VFGSASVGLSASAKVQDSVNLSTSREDHGVSLTDADACIDARYVSGSCPGMLCKKKCNDQYA